MVTTGEGYEAHYRCTQYCSKLGRYDDAINYLRTAIGADRVYIPKASILFNDLKKDLAKEDFGLMSLKFKDLMENLTKEEKEKADREIETSNHLINTFNDIGVPNDIKEKL